MAAIFFLQAEDGIRDLTVTGVQTCALPISSTSTGNSFSAAAGCGSTVTSVTMAAGTSSAIFYFKDTKAGGRSEERRVGKEGRSRWSPDPLKKKIDMNEYVDCPVFWRL